MVRNFLAWKYFPAVLLVAVGIVVAFFIVTDYGESWDEHLRYRYAEQSLAAYSTGEVGNLRDDKGPFYVMVSKLGADLLVKLHSGWQVIDGWHFMTFLSFMIAVWGVYAISVRFLSVWPSFLAAALFASQPLLWGHAFFNQKDMPFVGLFTVSVAAGLWMSESVLGYLNREQLQADESGNSIHFHSTLQHDWQSAGRRERRVWLILATGTLGLLLAMLFLRPLANEWIAGLVGRAYQAQSGSWLGDLFARQAQRMHAVPVENYIAKAQAWYPRLVSVYAGLALVFNGVLFWRLFPSGTAWLTQRRIKPFLREAWHFLERKEVWAAALLLGLSTSIRVLGPSSGLLIAGYLGLKLRPKNWTRLIPLLAVYFLIAGVVTYSTWPALWSNPLQNYLRSFQGASDIDWEGKVMYAGVDRSVDALPRSYLPVLLSLQFTEPVLALFAAGLVIGLVQFFRRRDHWQIFVMLSVWLFAPIVAVLLVQPRMYDNFRHFLFLTPPIFLISGISAQAVMDRLSKAPFKAAFVMLVLLPGFLAMAALHPYEYVYYNSLAGGVQGAFRQYEMDYWATSYREAAEYLNRTAPQNARVVVWGPDHLVQNYARPDLEIIPYDRFEPAPGEQGDYAVLSTRHDKDLTLFTDSPPVYQVGRAGGLFSVVKQIEAPIAGGNP